MNFGWLCFGTSVDETLWFWIFNSEVFECYYHFFLKFKLSISAGIYLA
jgi:hypothetical protein